MIDDVTWAALTLVLTALGGAWTFYAWRNRGAASAVRALALTMLPPAAYLTGTLKMFGRIVDAIVDWATAVVFSPGVWLGIVLFGISVLLFGTARVMSSRGKDDKPHPKQALGGEKAKSLPASSGGGEPAIDDDLADIEAILKRRGIS
ncbi:cellulose synthase [Nocardioides speluncae]|uniref:cellulose synthase n=1 Tax=Nocardioides speluncae TaxID=2670337 RepID=UPI000D695AEF|nr:cellulose synthase [Nocardioides speluncae]